MKFSILYYFLFIFLFDLYKKFVEHMEFYELFGVDSVRNNFYRFFSILLCIATLFMGVGYASINSISLNVSGKLTAQVQNGIFITQVNYVESNYADVNNSKIISASKTNLSSNIVLLNNSSAYITYEVTLYNSNYKDYYLYNVNYLAGNDTYSNPNISFKIDGLTYNTKIASRGYLTFELTFYYGNTSVSNVNNTLKSLLNFNFVEATSYELQSIYGDYALTTTCNAGEECKNMTVDNFVISIDEIVIPDPAYGLMTFSKTYDPSTGAFKIVRTRLTGTGFITYSGYVHMLSNPILIANKEGSYSISIDCTGVNNYKNMTVADFYYEIDWLNAPEALYETGSELNGVNGTINFTKSYNSSTGILTIQRSSIKGTGTVKFSVNVYIAG